MKEGKNKGMSKHLINSKLEELNQTDVYSMVLFGLYKLQGVNEYSTLSELPFILDHKSLDNLLEYYGGLTIRIPTKQELNDMIGALLLYQLVHLDNVPYDVAISELKQQDCKKENVLDMYSKLGDFMSNYEFKRS